jgi:Recombination endonuclease VII
MAKRVKKVKLYGMRKYWPHLTEEMAENERVKLSLAQGGKCGVCGKAESEFKNRLAVDHNHKTGQVRGLLCYRCNKFVVGRHTLESALRLLAYLKVEEK